MPEEQHPQTLPCPSCGEANFILELRCRVCGAYVRDRVPGLNLFSSLWGMVESPAATALRIGRSEQKNYTHVLFALAGPVVVAVAFFAAGVGDSTLSFATVMLTLVVAGPLAGLILFPLSVPWLRLLLRAQAGVRVRYRQAAAWTAWSLAPLMWASVILLPLMLAVHGPLLFSTNPAPWDALPLPFWSLGTLTALALPWSMVLLPLGFRVFGAAYAQMFRILLPYWLFPAAVVTATALLLRALL